MTIAVTSHCLNACSISFRRRISSIFKFFKCPLFGILVLNVATFIYLFKCPLFGILVLNVATFMYLFKFPLFGILVLKCGHFSAPHLLSHLTWCLRVTLARRKQSFSRIPNFKLARTRDHAGKDEGLFQLYWCARAGYLLLVKIGGNEPIVTFHHN